VTSKDELIAFSAFVDNSKDPLMFFDDRVFHAACFWRHPLADRAMARWEAKLSVTGPNRPPCHICGKPLRDPFDHEGLRHFTDDPHHSLFPFNLVQFHASCLAGWEERGRFLELVRKLVASGTWDSRDLDDLIKKLEAAGQ
jgi:hypothetical protein